MLQPSRRKYRKEQKGRNTGISHERGTKVSFGDFGLKAVGRGRITARQIEAARRAMTRHIKRERQISGSVCSRTSQFRKNLPKSVWVAARVIRNTMSQKSDLARFFMKWTEWMRLSP